jgi:hypothetical protein
VKETRIISLGAGVQSTAVALLAVHGEIPPVEHAVFADTGWEPKEVYDHLKWLTPVLEDAGMKVHKVSAGNIRKDSLSGGRFASIPFHLLTENGRALGRRQCTREYKITPLNSKQREIIGLKKRQRWKEENGIIINLMGISTDEIQRMKDNYIDYITNSYPLIDLRMSRNDCLVWMKEKGYPTPPRSACIGCPFHSDHEWRRIRDTDPDAWQDAIDFDKEIRRLREVQPDSQIGGLKAVPFLHKSCVPLDEADLRTEEDHGQINMFDMECEGMCGI